MFQITQQFSCSLITVIRIRFQTLHDDRCKNCIDLSPHILNIFCIAVFIHRRFLSTEQMIERSPKAVQIRAWICFFPVGRIQFILVIPHGFDLLRCRISIRISGHPGITAIQTGRNIKIDQADISIRPQHDVLRFQIPVYDRWLLFMHIAKRGTDLSRPDDHRFFFKFSAAVQILSKTVSLYKSHNSIHISVHFQKVIDLRKPGMTQIFQYIYFCTIVYKISKLCFYLFQHNISTQVFMIRLIHITTFSRSYFANNFVCLRYMFQHDLPLYCSNTV